VPVATIRSYGSKRLKYKDIICSPKSNGGSSVATSAADVLAGFLHNPLHKNDSVKPEEEQASS
jgi:hypothetical protein